MILIQEFCKRIEVVSVGALGVGTARTGGGYYAWGFGDVAEVQVGVCVASAGAGYYAAEE